MAKAYWVIEDCETCFGLGLDPENADDICPDCRGYDVTPLKIDEWLATFGGGEEWREKFRTKRAAVMAIDPFYARVARVRPKNQREGNEMAETIKEMEVKAFCPCSHAPCTHYGERPDAIVCGLEATVPVHDWQNDETFPACPECAEYMFTLDMYRRP